MKHFKQYSGFYIPYIVFLAALGGLLVFNGKAELHLWLISFHTRFGDFFFKYITHFGGSLPFIIGALLVLYKYKAAILVVGSQLLAGLVTQIAKNIFLVPRPKVFFGENFPDAILHQIEGVRLHSSKSFPSGHTTAAFAFFLSLAFLTKNKSLQFLYLVLAALTGYSRIYLSQHFALDVFVGSIVGVSMTIVTYFIIQKYVPRWGEDSLRAVFPNKNRPTV